MVEKVSDAATSGDDLPTKQDPDGKCQKQFVSNRRLWFISCVMLLAVLSLAIGLGVGTKSSGTSLSKSENISKLSWPELVGMDAENASVWMKENYPEYNVYIVNYGEYVTTDFDAKRVRIYKAPNGTVYAVPKVGR